MASSLATSVVDVLDVPVVDMPVVDMPVVDWVELVDGVVAPDPVVAGGGSGASME
jgi:hypothetical protein